MATLVFKRTLDPIPSGQVSISGSVQTDAGPIEITVTGLGVTQITKLIIRTKLGDVVWLPPKEST